MILIGGGAPCQGNTELNMRRKGTEDPRTVGAKHAPRIERELREEAKRRRISLPPICTWIGNVGSASKDVIQFYSGIIAQRPFQI